SPQIGLAAHKMFGSSAGGISSAAVVLATFGVFWTIFEFATVAANALFTALINDVVPVAVLGRFYGLFRALSLIAGMIFNFWLIGKAEIHYTLLFVTIGVLYGGGFLLMCLKVREGEYPPAPPAAPPTSPSGTGPL